MPEVGHLCLLFSSQSTSSLVMLLIIFKGAPYIYCFFSIFYFIDFFFYFIISFILLWV